MKKIILTLFIAGSACLSYAQPPEGDANPGDWYGEKISPEGAVALKDVAAKLYSKEEAKQKDPEQGKIKAKVLDVCPKKGCWLSLELENGEKAFVKMQEYAFFVPLAAKGKTVVIDGDVTIKTTSVSELRHYAEDAKKSKEEIEAITEPKKEVRVMAKGIVVVE